MSRLARPSVVLGALLLAGCAAGPGGPHGRGRALRPVAQPTDVIATEIAFARAAREEGQWTAFADYAADDAVMFVPQAVNARDWLRGRADPPVPERWATREAWSSCDGSAVLVAGIGTDSAGTWSRFTRVWRRQDNGRQRWVYTMSVPDPTLAQARQDREQARSDTPAADENAILVEASSFIRAKVADCTVPPGMPLPGDSPEGAAGGQTAMSRDSTLQWRWHTDAENRGSLAAYFWTGTGWDMVVSEGAAPPAG